MRVGRRMRGRGGRLKRGLAVRQFRFFALILIGGFVHRHFGLRLVRLIFLRLFGRSLRILGLLLL